MYYIKHNWKLIIWTILCLIAWELHLKLYIKYFKYTFVLRLTCNIFLKENLSIKNVLSNEILKLQLKAKAIKPGKLKRNKKLI